MLDTTINYMYVFPKIKVLKKKRQYTRCTFNLINSLGFYISWPNSLHSKEPSSFYWTLFLISLISLQFTQCYIQLIAKFNHQSQPSHSWDFNTCNNARLEFFHNFCFTLWSKGIVHEKWPTRKVWIQDLSLPRSRLFAF